MGTWVSRLLRPFNGAGSSVDGAVSSPPPRTLSGTLLSGQSWGESGNRRTQSLPSGHARHRAQDQQAAQAARAFWSMKSHVKARCEFYPRADAIKRFHVPDDKVAWSKEFPEYSPVDFTHETVLKMPPWADVDFRKTVLNGDDESKSPKWNHLDGRINRRSHMGKYQVEGSVPRNPVGRTGLCGRGALGRWGPNHAADPIVTRWKRDSKGEMVKDKEGRPILEFIAVKRRDNGQWAIPGGMVDAGEVVTMTLRREFGEEALNTLEASKEEKKKTEDAINELFSHGVEVYRGYVDDPRNTDNAWMETVAMNFHDHLGNGVARFKLNAGDDAVGVQWMELSKELQLYASHIDFLHTAAEKLQASW